MKPKFFILAAAIACLSAGSAAAQANRTFVSGSGLDTNPCSLGSPCRSFAQALTQTNSGGEIVALDAAGYGALTITKAVTITAIGIEASITSSAASPTAITVNAGASAVVKLRGLSLFSGTNGGMGIAVLAGKSVTIENCTITGFPTDGILVEPAAGTVNVTVRGVKATNNGTNGFSIAPVASGSVTAFVENSLFSGNGGSGINIDGSSSTGAIKAMLNAIAETNQFQGILVTTLNGKAQPVVMVASSKLASNSFDGLNGSGNATVYVDRSQLSGNGANGWEAANPAVVKSFTTNQVGGNGNDTLNGVTQISSE